MEKTKNKMNPLSFSKLPPDKKRISQHIIFAILMVVLACIGIWKAIIIPANTARFEQATEQLLETQKKVLINYKSSIEKKLSDYTQQEKVHVLLNDLTKEALASEPSTTDKKNQLLELQQGIRQSLPYTKRVQFYLPRQAQTEKNNGGTISFVELNMINRMENNTATYPEIAKSKNSEEWEIHWVSPVHRKIDGKIDTNSPPIGILYASTSLDGLTQAMSAYDRQLAQTQLSQRIGRQGILTFLTLGNGNYSAPKAIDISMSHWQIKIQPSSLLYRKSSLIPLWLIALVASMSIAALWGAYILAQRKNVQEAALYKALDISPSQKKQPTSKETAPDTISDPLYLSDQQLVIEDADQALVDGSHQNKEHDPSSSPSSAVMQNDGAGIDAPAHIFRAYDIRGLIDTELTPAIAEAVGKAVATEALEQGETALIIGYDARTHSPLLHEHVKQGVLSTGCDVIQAGLVPTPLLNFAAFFSDQSSSGIVITASHNPKSYNGFKIIINECTLVDEDIQRLYQRVSNGTFTQGKAGQVREENFTEDYIDTVLADIAINSGLHIVIDAANGAASELAPTLFNELGCQVTPLFCNFDGEFPNHDPDPSIDANLVALVEKVKSEGADIGIALDGDGDRLVAVTSSGRIIWPDQLLMLFARDVVSRNPGCDVIFDIKSTRQLNQVISSYGGRPVMWKTGHSHIKAKMRETGALLAGEFSGHIFFKERWFGFDDGIYAAARLLEIMSLRDQSLDAMIEAMPPMFATPEIKIAVPEEQKFDIVEKLIEQGDFPAGEKTTIDGLRVDFDKGWGLVRASNTTAALTLRFEAQNENGIEQLKTLFKRELQKIDRSLSLDF